MAMIPTTPPRTKKADPKLRYERLAEALLASDNPVKAIASLIGDHEARLDLLADRMHHVECRLGEGE